MADKKIPEPPKYVPDGCVLVELPDGHWVVLLRSLSRGVAQQLRNQLWEAGILPGMPSSQFSGAQWVAWEDDWANRMVAYVKSWSLIDEDGQLLPVERASIDLMDDSAYIEIKTRISAIMNGPTAEESKSEGAPYQRLGEGDADGSRDATADASPVSENAKLVERVGSSVSG